MIGKRETGMIGKAGRGAGNAFILGGDYRVPGIQASASWKARVESE